MYTSMEFLSKIRSHSKKHSTPCIFCNNEVQCSKEPINSHNIQKNKILNALSKDKHVYVLSDSKSNNDKFELSLEKKGINKVSIFRCLCLEHDTEIFKPIELVDYTGKPEQQTLYALKSLLYEFWKLDYASSFYSVVRTMGNISLEQKLLYNIVLDDNIESLAYCKEELNLLFNMLNDNNYKSICTYEISLDYSVMFSVSQSCCIYTDFSGKALSKKKDYFPFVHISIFPENSKTNIIFSWLKKDNHYYSNFFAGVQQMKKTEILSKLNLLLPMCCENIILSPALFNYWSESDRNEFSKISHVNVEPEISTQGGKFCVDNWLGQVSYDLFAKLLDEQP